VWKDIFITINDFNVSFSLVFKMSEVTLAFDLEHEQRIYRYMNCTATDRSASQPNVIKENSADRHPVVQLTSPKTGT
jgi:hypothetical protein